MMTDPIADMLTRIRNALKAKHEEVEMPSSKMKTEIAAILKEEGYIKNYHLIEDSKQGLLKIYFKYGERGESVIRGLKRISKPGCRIYTKSKNIPRVANGLGITILTTPKGVLPDRTCRQQKVGGEVLCYIW
jgi:small subunit ribosomal protein S8